MPVGQTGDALFLGANWVVYRVLIINSQIPMTWPSSGRYNQQLLDARRKMAFEAFHTALDNRMKQDGTLRINADNLKRLWTPSSS